MLERRRRRRKVDEEEEEEEEESLFKADAVNEDDPEEEEGEEEEKEDTGRGCRGDAGGSEEAQDIRRGMCEKETHDLVQINSCTPCWLCVVMCHCVCVSLG